MTGMLLPGRREDGVTGVLTVAAVRHRGEEEQIGRTGARRDPVDLQARVELQGPRDSGDHLVGPHPHGRRQRAGAGMTAPGTDLAHLQAEPVEDRHPVRRDPEVGLTDTPADLADHRHGRLQIVETVVPVVEQRVRGGKFTGQDELLGPVVGAVGRLGAEALRPVHQMAAAVSVPRRRGPGSLQRLTLLGGVLARCDWSYQPAGARGRKATCVR
ncbi:hypothetical protein ACFQ51_50685 [Streptomyces kaempferi]